MDTELLCLLGAGVRRDSRLQASSQGDDSGEVNANVVETHVRGRDGAENGTRKAGQVIELGSISSRSYSTATHLVLRLRSHWCGSCTLVPSA
jgi:hypothetical protein